MESLDCSNETGVSEMTVSNWIEWLNRFKNKDTRGEAQ